MLKPTTKATPLGILALLLNQAVRPEQLQLMIQVVVMSLAW